MINISVGQLKQDITPKLKGTSLSQVKDFYGIVTRAAGRMYARIDPEESRRTFTLSTPFFASVQTYAMATDYKRMIDIRPTTKKRGKGNSDFGQTNSSQFRKNFKANSFAVQYDNGVRTLQARILPDGNCTVIDPFESASSNGLWVASADAGGLYTEPLNYIQGSSDLGLNLSGVTGVGIITNTTVPAALDLSSFNWEDTSFIYICFPVGTSSRFTSIQLTKGDDATDYRTASVNQQADGTPFSDGWNFLLFVWQSAAQTGSPTNTKNQYRVLTFNYSIGTAIDGVLVDSWTNDLGKLYEMEYYSEYLFRNASTGAWQYAPLLDTDLLSVGPALYEILQTEMMIDITQIIRQGAVRTTELADWRLMLNGTAASRYVKDPPYHGLYQDYEQKFPSYAIVETTDYYHFDV